ncbi:MAG: TetR/AcrR family transcriptional regulator [Lachnospiraceae bacterium]|nr:TetR/AcrR family transcriptional regulator [Lachnospiraceae bacterium]
MDRRTVRSAQSKAALKTAFLELFQTEEPDQITVVELCEKAGLNRSTFYAHYEFMDQLIREVLWESVEEVFDGLSSQWDLPLEDGGVARDFIDAYLHRFMGNPTIKRFFTCVGHQNYLPPIIRAHVDLTLGPSTSPARYYAAYLHNAGVLNLLLEWFNNGARVPKETITEIIHEFSKVMYRDWS